MADAFLGKFTVVKRDNYDAFMKGVGVPDEYIEKGRNSTVVTEISKDGDVYTVTRTRPLKTTTNSFKLGVETEMDTIKGDKVKATVNMEGNKMVSKGDNYEVVTEMDGNQLKESITLKGQSMTRWSDRS